MVAVFVGESRRAGAFGLCAMFLGESPCRAGAFGLCAKAAEKSGARIDPSSARFHIEGTLMGKGESFPGKIAGMPDSDR